MAKEFRVLLYEGDQDWINRTFARNHVCPGSPLVLPNGNRIIDLARINVGASATNCSLCQQVILPALDKL